MTVVKFKLSAFLTQASASILIASLWCLSGLLQAWFIKEVHIFTSQRYIDTMYDQLHMTTSLVMLLVTPCTGLALSFGRKYSFVIFGIPFVLAWIVTVVAGNVDYISLYMALAGIGFAGRAVSLVYITEVVEDSFRGCLSTFVVIELCIGTLFSDLPYDLILYLNLIVSGLCVVLILFLKESPVLLVQLGNIEEAAKSIAFYRRVDVASKEVETEINKIKLQLEPSDETVEGDAEKSSSWKRALGCVVFLVLASSLLQNVIYIFLNELHIVMSSSDAFVQMINLTAILICAGVVDCFGRKFLVKWTSALLTVISLGIAVQMTFRFSGHSVLFDLLYAYTFILYLGVATVPIILSAEVFSPKVRGICVPVTMFVMVISQYLSNAAVRFVVHIVDPTYIFYGVSILCFIVTLFSHFCLPETKGLSIDEIQLLFKKKGKIVEKPGANKV